MSIKLEAPLLPLRDIIVFPYQVVPLFVGRQRSIAALEAAMSQSKEILLCAQKKAKTNEPKPDDLHEIGTLASIIQMLRLPDGTVKVLVEGKRRARVISYLENEAHFLVEIEDAEPADRDGVEIEAHVRSVKSFFETYIKLNKRVPPETLSVVQGIDDSAKLADTIATYLTLKLPEKQELIELIDIAERLEKLLGYMQAEVEILQVERKIRSRVKKQMERTQKEYYLNEQMAAIQKELGDRDEMKSEMHELEERLAEKDMPEEAEKRIRSELKKLKMMSPMSAEATVVRNYVDWALALPWATFTEDDLSIDRAERILDEDHHGLKKVKERILEHLAVQALVERPKGPILCLVGPPGVGKTSLAKSIARSMKREFVRISLGGVRDEAEIRGHRRTYIGAMPGKLIQSLKRAGSNNPVILLDEIDKMSSDVRGDPSAAMLEVLDPEQNHAFNDHYLDLDYDLSRILFIATANTTNTIPGPLLDRMEMIHLGGYTEIEKMAIAKQYLVPKQKTSNGLDDVALTITDGAIQKLIRQYTREAGVRNLDRELSSVCRKIAREVVKSGDKAKKRRITPQNMEKLLGVWKYRYGVTEDRDEIGLTTGLAWTSVGGEILNIEVSIMPGKGRLIITGKLGDVMQESAQAAMSYVRSRSDLLGLDRLFYQNIDVHIHVPEGAMPKDGPSAGITMATSLVSSLLAIPVRRDLAMTGEITLRGRVLPIGGLKEKVLAAHRANVTTVICPAENEKDIADIPKSVTKDLEIICVDHVDDVLKHALVLDNPEEFYLKLKGQTVVSQSHVKAQPSATH